MSDVSRGAMAEAIKQNTTLRTLSIDPMGTQTGEKGLVAMVEAIKQNSSLFVFDPGGVSGILSDQTENALFEASTEIMVRNRRVDAQGRTLVQLARWVDGGGFHRLKEKGFRNNIFELFFPSCCAFLPLD